jgi:phosphoribosyl 1,2-cyclic phosphodiesterase
MSLFIASLNSGSNGNSYYVGNDNDAVLIDVGISCREVEKRMKRLGLSMEKIKAVFISHEHGDHIFGVPALSKRHKLPVYITQSTLRGSNITIPESFVYSFDAYEPVTIGSLTVTAFPKYHDAVDPHSFVVMNETVRVGIFTDIGFPCQHVIHQFKQCHAAFLEANYDASMLEAGSYPLALKSRIRGGQGHLSNHEAARLFTEHRPAFMSHLILSHLSRNNNKPDLVEDTFKAIAGTTQIVVASRNKESKLYAIQASGHETMVSKSPVKYYKQLSLFQ